MRYRAIHRAMAATSLLLGLVMSPACAQLAGINDPSPSCANGKQDVGENGVDCGGVCVGACKGAKCAGAADCASGACGKDGTCAEATCSDQIFNGAESDVDCGGPVTSCPRCPDTKKCSQDSDCLSGICNKDGDTCKPSCGDQVLNGNETDADCGGPDTTCDRCLPGKQCKANTDCQSDNCVKGICTCRHCATLLATGVTDAKYKELCTTGLDSSKSLFDKLVTCVCTYCTEDCGFGCTAPKDAMKCSECINNQAQNCMKPLMDCANDKG